MSVCFQDTTTAATALCMLAEQGTNCACTPATVNRIYLDDQDLVCYAVEAALDALESSVRVHKLAAQLTVGTKLYFFVLWKDEDGKIIAELLRPRDPTSAERAPTFNRTDITTIVA